MNFLKTLHNPTPTEFREALQQNTVVHVSDPPSDPESYYLKLSQFVGDLVNMDEDLATGNKNTLFWTDIKYDKKIQNSYRHSNTRQPLHTDGSYEKNAPDLSFFYCIEKAKFGGATTFLPYDVLVSMLEEHDPTLLERLSTTTIQISKGNDGKSAKIIDNGKLTWNYFRVEPCSLREEFHRFLEDVVVESCVANPLHLHPGEAVFFWDEHLLHGRNAFLGNRWLKKGGIKWKS